MRLGRKSVIALVFAGSLAAVGAGLAIAQDGDDDDAGEGAGGEFAVQRRADLSGPEQIAEAQRIQTSGESLSRRVTAMLDEARREGDVIRVTCLDDKLTQINAHRRTLGDRLGSLQESVQLSDDSRRNHEFTVISVLAQHLQNLDREANECIGQDMYETGATRVTTTIDSTTPDEDPTVVPEVPVVDVPFIPPPGSPIR